VASCSHLCWRDGKVLDHGSGYPVGGKSLKTPWRGRGGGRLGSKILVLYRTLCQVWELPCSMLVSIHPGMQSSRGVRRTHWARPSVGRCENRL
jgi:hypothetical protein